jgi:hypothetical protein
VSAEAATDAAVGERLAALRGRLSQVVILVKSRTPMAYDGWTRIEAPTVPELLDELEERFPARMAKCPPHDWETIYDDGHRISQKCRDCPAAHSWSR